MDLDVAAREGRFEDEGWRKRKDGSLFLANVVITALRNDAGTLVAFAKVTRDLTERRRAEDERVNLESERKARFAADAANHAKDEFLAHVSVDLPLVVERAIDSVRPSTDAKSIRVNSSIDAPIPLMVADPARLQQVVWNLLTNAVKFTPRNGQIDVSLQHDGEQLELTIKDSGIGIGADAIAHVFSPFRQAPGAHATASRGLGLAIVRSIVELHGGRVEARGAGIGAGGAFAIHLPLAARRTESAAAPSTSLLVPTSARLHGLRMLLIVEDDDDARDSMSESWAQLSNGARARSLTRPGPPM